MSLPLAFVLVSCLKQASFSCLVYVSLLPVSCLCGVLRASASYLVLSGIVCRCLCYRDRWLRNEDKFGGKIMVPRFFFWVGTQILVKVVWVSAPPYLYPTFQIRIALIPIGCACLLILSLQQVVLRQVLVWSQPCWVLGFGFLLGAEAARGNALESDIGLGKILQGATDLQGFKHELGSRLGIEENKWINDVITIINDQNRGLEENKWIND